MDRSDLPPVDVIYRPPLREDPYEMQNVEAARQRHRSLALGILTAITIHAVLIAIFIAVTIGAMKEDLPPLVVVTEGYDPQEQVTQQAINTRVTERPAPPSMHSANTIVAASAVAPISAPNIEKPVNDPLELGQGLGLDDGLGFGGDGDGFGGAQFMGLKGGGKNIILVIDTSSSMPRNCGENGISAIRREVNKTINGFSARTRFNIICYANDADAFAKESVPATTANKVAAMKFMQIYFSMERVNRTRTATFGGSEDGAEDPDGVPYYPIYPESLSGLEGTSGGSRIELGVVAAMERMPSTIFVLSDGAPSTTRDGRSLGHDDLVDVIRENYRRIYKGRKLTINTLSIRNLGEGFLRKISQAFHGRHQKIFPKRL